MSYRTIISGSLIAVMCLGLLTIFSGQFSPQAPPSPKLFDQHPATTPETADSARQQSGEIDDARRSELQQSGEQQSGQSSDEQKTHEVQSQEASHAGAGLSGSNTLAPSPDSAVPVHTATVDSPAETHTADSPVEARGMAPESTVDQGPPQVWGYQIKAEYPHDPHAFLQGLLYHEGYLYESTGMFGESSVRKVEMNTGKVLLQTDMPRSYFGEGLTLWGDQLMQVTWRTNQGFRYDLQTLKQVGDFQHPYQDGWGLDHNGKELIMTDSGTDLLFLDPGTLNEVRRVTVTDAGEPVEMVNEIEFIDGEVFANFFGSDCIARVDPLTGKVKGWLVLDDILARVGKSVQNRKNDNILNGIAWNKDTKRLLVSGKRWPSLFEIEMIQDTTANLEQVRDSCIPKRNIFHRL